MPGAAEAEVKVDLVGEYCAAMRGMPFAEAVRLHNDFGIPWRSITAACPAPARARFANRERSLYEPAEDGRAVWILPAACCDPLGSEEIETVDPPAVVASGPIIDLVAFDFRIRDRFALRTGAATVLGCVEPQCMQPERVAVWSDISDWLRAGCTGIVLLTADHHQRGRILRRCAAIEAQQPDRVKAWIALPEYPAQITPSVFAMRAA
jgi:hypothetical protein